MKTDINHEEKHKKERKKPMKNCRENTQKGKKSKKPLKTIKKITENKGKKNENLKPDQRTSRQQRKKAIEQRYIDRASATWFARHDTMQREETACPVTTRRKNLKAGPA